MRGNGDGGIYTTAADVHVLWDALGIADTEVHDYDDVSSIADLGLQRSILWRDPAAK